ncbi:MAG: hypothetical protein KGZ63_07365 [Clostridiales bacterium]|jgi:ABC-type lipoprotein export system ATPase subunit|nr:hypothetical protein [Clostridiales bacterium]
MSTEKQKKYSVFKNGSTWLRADFHLHTKADKEFEYNDEDNQFLKDYIKKLKESSIKVGVITNHNKFDAKEFITLRKKAISEEIFLLPGVELSVKDGSSGIHTLVIFSDDWFINQGNTDYINNFLNITFAGQFNYHNENARSNHDLIDTIRELDKFGKDFFMLFAHVEAKNGLWGGFSGGRIKELGETEFFKRVILGFQKVRTHEKHDGVCRSKVQGWLGDRYPAEVEGSDCKSINEIGKGNRCFLKLGDFTFEAVKYALRDYKNRVSTEPITYKHSYVKAISFEGGVLNGQTVNFSPELNALIGIRGSGKSSILEAIRYVLDIPFGEKSLDQKYKESLVRHTFGSGGKAVILAVDRHGTEYEVSRIINEPPDVYTEGNLYPGVKIRETILYKPIYFGQKDLSSTGEGFEKDLVEKLVGEKLIDLRRRIEDYKSRVFQTVDRLQKLSSVDEQKKEYELKKQDAEFRLKIFRENGVEERLQKQVDFDADERKIKQITEFLNSYLASLAELISQFEDDFANMKLYNSKQNKIFFSDFFAIYDTLKTNFDTHKQILLSGQKDLQDIKKKAAEFENLKKGLKEEFANIERKLSEELKDSGTQSIRPEEFLRLRKIVDNSKQMLDALDKQQLQKTTVDDELIRELTALNDLWHEEFRLIQTELDKINKNQPALTIVADYKGDKEAFTTFMKEMFKGSRIRENTFQSLANQFSDFNAMFRDFEKAKKETGTNAALFEKYYMENLKALLTWQVPNRFTIKYREKELKQHSLGQRASALILFVLSQRENDVIIIDQPEDDLDNQTIYEDVIKLIRGIKVQTQFIFATHNANFPVLGDAEQIHSCKYSNEKIELTNGSIDSPTIQKEIVNIMEGGEEAFNRRKEIYQIWNPRN